MVTLYLDEEERESIDLDDVDTVEELRNKVGYYDVIYSDDLPDSFIDWLNDSKESKSDNDQALTAVMAYHLACDDGNQDGFDVWAFWSPDEVSAYSLDHEGLYDRFCGVYGCCVDSVKEYVMDMIETEYPDMSTNSMTYQALCCVDFDIVQRELELGGTHFLWDGGCYHVFYE